MVEWTEDNRMREFPSPQEILKVFEREPARTFRLRELVVELGLRSSQARELKNVLKSLARHKRIAYLKKNHFALVRAGDRPADPRRLTGPGFRQPNPGARGRAARTSPAAA